MSYKAASYLVLGWGIFMLAAGGSAYYFMGIFATSLLVMAGLAGALAFSIGHFLNRGRKQAFIMALAMGIFFVFMLGWRTSIAFSAEENIIFTDALAANPRNVSLLVSSAMLTTTVLMLLLLLLFAKPIYQSFPKLSD